MPQPIQARLRSACAGLRRQPMPLAGLIPLLQQAADALDKLERDGPLMRRGTDGAGNLWVGTMRECLEDARLAARAEAQLGDQARAELKAVRARLASYEKEDNQ